MNQNDSQRELLLRHLDGRLTQDERRRVAELLRTDPEARAFVRAVAEQAVMVADLERVALGRQEELHLRPLRPADQGRKILPVRFRSWRWGVAAAAAVAVLAVLASQLVPTIRPGLVRVSKVTGSSQYFGFKGRAEKVLTAGTSLVSGDTLETRSCDAWVELKLRDDSTITVAGHSTLRILESKGGGKQFKLLQGSLWGSPAPRGSAEAVLIQTPTVAAEMRGAQFDIQTSPTETMVRVNEGSARVSQNLDGSTVEVSKGRQVAASLSRKEPLSVTPQPAPIDSWATDLWRIPEVILGKWLPPTGNERARLGADPLLRPAGETWEVELPLRDFRPLHPQLASSPDGLELADVYALTIQEDAGLEIHHIELLPGAAAKPLAKR